MAREQRRVSLSVKLNPKERALIERAATRAGKLYSEFIRDVALHAAHETLTKGARP